MRRPPPPEDGGGDSVNRQFLIGLIFFDSLFNVAVVFAVQRARIVAGVFQRLLQTLDLVALVSLLQHVECALAITGFEHTLLGRLHVILRRRGRRGGDGHLPLLDGKRLDLVGDLAILQRRVLTFQIVGERSQAGVRFVDLARLEQFHRFGLRAFGFDHDRLRARLAVYRGLGERGVGGDVDRDVARE